MQKAKAVDSITRFLHKCQEEYHRGTPLISDAEFDTLADKYGFNQLGYTPPSENRVKLPYPMYSLQKVFDDEKRPNEGHDQVTSTKLDGAAISLTYIDGYLVEAITRGDGEIGEDILHNVMHMENIPLRINNFHLPTIQVTGEVVAPKIIDNARNYASGALHLKNVEEFKARDITFIAYGVYPYIRDYYREDLSMLGIYGFDTVLDSDWEEYPSDGIVFRIDHNGDFEKLGYTSKHPRGAFALKKRSDVATEETKLLEVKWQVGKGGKVTPVAIFEPVIIDDAKIQRATLHNVGFIEKMELEIGDTLLVTRSGGIIPKVVGKL